MSSLASALCERWCWLSLSPSHTHPQPTSTTSQPPLPLPPQATGAVAGLGIDDKLVDSVATAAKPVVSAAGTVAGSAAEVLATSSPVTAAEYVAVAALGVYLTPSLFGLLFDLLRGYRGDLTATLAVDKLQSDRSAVLVDVRAAKEKDVAGLPDVPGSAAARLLAVEFATTEDRQLRNQLRNPTAVETTVTALQVNIGGGGGGMVVDGWW